MNKLQRIKAIKTAHQMGLVNLYATKATTTKTTTKNKKG